MEKVRLKYWVDVGMGISFLAVFITGIIKFRKILTLLGIEINYQSGLLYILSKVHDWSGVFMGLFVVIHLILNFDWIVCETKSFFCKEPKTICKTKK
ncbi:MAG: DUF4405 domain-containing protein [archaeon]|nr:DUF4405 domain-containing protein [archaeon]